MEKIMKIKIYFLLIIINFISVTYSFALNGKGTKEDPYQIKNINDLQDIYSFTGSKIKYFKLMNDIDASETRYWNVYDHDSNPNTPDEPMGFIPIQRFFGYLDGNGYIIYNLYINLPNAIAVGLFGFLWGGGPDDHSEVRRLGLENCNITGRYLVGGLVGRMVGGFIEKCFTHGKVTSTDTIEEGEGIGGFCGDIGDGKIENCYSSCTVTSIGEKSDYSVGSFCSGQPRYRQIYACYTTGKIISKRKATAFGDIENAENSYWDVETTGIPDDGSHKAKGFPTLDMMKQSTYFGFDFEETWCIDEGRDYPKLRAFPNKCPPDVFPKDPFIDVSSCDFGDILVNETATDSIIIKNTGKEELVITGFTGPSQPSVFVHNLPEISEASPLRLAPDQSFSFEVTFRPAEEKTYTDSIFFISNTVKTYNPDSVAELLGKGIIPKQPEISVTDGNFNYVKTGSKDTATLIIKNTGDDVLSVRNYYLNQNSFFKPIFSREINDSNQLILQPLDSFKFDVEFNAPDTIIKNITDSIVFSSNATKGDSIALLSVDSVVTSVVDNYSNINNRIELYPNPSFTSIDVVFNLQREGNTQIIITNSYGQQVFNANVNNINTNNEKRHSINISSFPSGLYFVTLLSSAVAMSKGVVVIK
ncbi:MAG: choice-of-anchor D domain-containing protein [Bacteroidetes bacterium]|nr:MAG: choice-of-anchor D domain-containing protein [Bacteroidota bacterium]